MLIFGVVFFKEVSEMIDFEKTLLLPLRVRRNCLSGGKYGFTFASSPVALSGKMKPKIMTSCIYFIVLSKVQLPRVDFRQWCLEILQLTSTSNSLVFFCFVFCFDLEANI